MKIHELEELLGVSKATIRHYEDQGLVTPSRTENKYRDYNDDEVLLLQKILVMRKLGVSIPEIKELIEGSAELHDVLDRNVDRLRTRQNEIASAIEMCGELGSEAADFAGIDSPRYLRQIYEEEQKGAHFVEANEISVRQLNLAITLLGALAGVAVPQNKLFSEHSNEPLPADIRGNKKEGDEYATIGNVLEKGGKLKVVLIAAVAILIVMAVFTGLYTWGVLG